MNQNSFLQEPKLLEGSIKFHELLCRICFALRHSVQSHSKGPRHLHTVLANGEPLHKTDTAADAELLQLSAHEREIQGEPFVRGLILRTDFQGSLAVEGGVAFSGTNFLFLFFSRYHHKCIKTAILKIVQISASESSFSAASK